MRLIRDAIDGTEIACNKVLLAVSCNTCKDTKHHCL